MRLPQHARMSVTRRGEKELRLGAFLARALAGMAPPGQDTAAPPPARREIEAIARSPRSPVVKAIGAHAKAVAAAGGTVRLILARTDGLGASDALAAMRGAGLACEVRLARNPRLIEAHEQLTVGARVAWTGDTMRRDPATSDAYESFAEDCPEIAAAAAATFARLWADCAPLSVAALAAAGRAATPVPSAGLPTRRA